MTGGFDVPLVDEVADTGARWAGTAHILGPRWARLPLLSLGLIGVQLLWSVEMSYASPYLISLGLSKSGMAMVFVAGPISGLVVQPLIGLLADTSKSRFGRRRPYILAGTAFCSFFILVLGYTRQFASIVTTTGSSANDRLTIWLAVFSIFCIDFGINAVMSMDRALIVDTLPSEKQPIGSAWAARMMGIGSVVGFFIGGLNMPSLFPFFGSTEIEVISALSAMALIVTHGITCYCTKERVLISLPEQRRTGFVAEVKSTWTTFRSLPYPILQICIIQFFAWLGWFPVLFYTSLYVGDFYRRSTATSSTITSEYIEEEANRLGSRAMTISAVLTLLTNFAAPLLVTKRATVPDGLANPGPKPWYKRKMHMATIWAFSHMFFATCMLATFFVGTVVGATIVMCLTGICWGITLWAPFALLGEEIVASTSEASAEETIVLADHRTPLQSREEVFAVADDSDEDEDDDRTAKPNLRPRWSGDGDDPRTALMGNVDARQSWIDIGASSREVEGPLQAPSSRSGLSAKAGTILGIHNTFIVAPQFLVTGLASIIFAIFEPDKSAIHGGKRTASQNATSTAIDSALELIRRDDSSPPEAAANGINTTAIIFRLGGVAAVVAAVICWRLAGYLRRRG